MTNRTVLRTCPLCEAVCGLQITLDESDRVVEVRGDREDPFSKGFICPKGASLGRVDEDPDLLTGPMIRTGDSWREATWDEAFDAVAAGLGEVIERHGRSAVAIYAGNPNAHTVAGALYLPLLVRALGSRNFYSASSVGPDAQARIGGADVRRPAGDPGTRPRPHRLPADARRQPARIQRITVHRAGFPRSAARDSGAWRQGCGG